MPSLGFSGDHCLDVEVFNTGGMGLDKVFARQNLVAHQHTENPVCFGGVFHVNLKECACSGIHGGLP